MNDQQWEAYRLKNAHRKLTEEQWANVRRKTDQAMQAIARNRASVVAVDQEAPSNKQLAAMSLVAQGLGEVGCFCEEVGGRTHWSGKAGTFVFDAHGELLERMGRMR